MTGIRQPGMTASVLLGAICIAPAAILRADYAFGTYRYFPGRRRELFIELRYFPRFAQQER
ncbi:MAG: hypothetical protein GY783_21900 [Gammaproteobacteria bacterium]|nr:hypothetical protein [Gammaproteobacteria bacterium]